MRGADNVLIAKTTEKLEDIMPKLNKVSGLPVVDANNRVIGVISRKVRLYCAACCNWCLLASTAVCTRLGFIGLTAVAVCLIC